MTTPTPPPSGWSNVSKVVAIVLAVTVAVVAIAVGGCYLIIRASFR